MGEAAPRLPSRPLRLTWGLLGALGAGLLLPAGCPGGWDCQEVALLRLLAGWEQASVPTDSAYCLCRPARVFCRAPALMRLLGSGCTHSVHHALHGQAACQRPCLCGQR